MKLLNMNLNRAIIGTCLTACLIGLIFNFALSSKKPVSDLISIGYLTHPLSYLQKKQVKRDLDAIIVRDQTLVHEPKTKKIGIPIFFIPENLDLEPFLNEPLKTHVHPVFTFGHILSFKPLDPCVSLIRAFSKTFGNRQDVSLVLYCPSKYISLKTLKKILAEQETHNIILLNSSMPQHSEIEFFKSIDGYINLEPV